MQKAEELKPIDAIEVMFLDICGNFIQIEKNKGIIFFNDERIVVKSLKHKVKLVSDIRNDVIAYSTYQELFDKLKELFI